jgi:hypothetical protein
MKSDESTSSETNRCPLSFGKGAKNLTVQEKINGKLPT